MRGIAFGSLSDHMTPSMNPNERIRFPVWGAIAAVSALCWAGFAYGVVPPMLAAEHPGPLVEALVRFLHVPPVLFLTQDPPGQWREFAGAVLIAMALHFAVVRMLDHQERTGRIPRRLAIIQAMIAMAFLAVPVLAPKRQDYFYYLEMWYHVRHGNDPWFMVASRDGMAPLNAYGPLFNPLAVLAWMNPLAAKLLFSEIYILFAITMTRDFVAGRPPSTGRGLACLALFWNPFAWVEVAFYGHFDLLVGLACVASVRDWAAGRDVRSGLSLAGGVLLKFLPVVLLPFLGLERDGNRPRLRFLAVALGTIALGLGLSCLIWGPSTFRPLTLAPSRSATTLSIFHFLHSSYSPLVRLRVPGNYQQYALPIQLVALFGAWRWSRLKKPDIEAASLVAVLVLVLLYRVGYPQYQMVPFVMATAWLLARWDRLPHRKALVAAIALYFGWLSVFDVIYMLSDTWGIEVGWNQLEEFSGLPTFILGSALVACVVRAGPLPAAPTRNLIGAPLAGTWVRMYTIAPRSGS